MKMIYQLLHYWNGSVCLVFYGLMDLTSWKLFTSSFEREETGLNLHQQDLSNACMFAVTNSLKIPDNILWKQKMLQSHSDVFSLLINSYRMAAKVGAHMWWKLSISFSTISPKGYPIFLWLTNAHQVHEAVHGIADLEEQVLSLPLGWRAKRRPHQPWDAGDEKEGAKHSCRYLYLLNHCQRDGLPLHKERGRKTEKKHQLNQPKPTDLSNNGHIWALRVRSSKFVNWYKQKSKHQMDDF